MKWIISILVVITLIQCKTKNNETKNEEVNEQPAVVAEEQSWTNELIGEPLDSELEIEEKYNIKLNFSIHKIYEYDINKDGIKEKIILDKLDEWNDPGDFHRIRIEYKDTCFTFYNSSGWIKTNYSANYYISDFKSVNEIDSEYIILRKNNDNLLLFAFGYVYASNPGLLSIINLSIKEPQLILNDNCLLVQYEDSNTTFVTTRYFREDEINQRDTLILNKNGYINRLHH
ncbi:MAG: hypothetical protein LBJ63_11475 [Prevotellaceae bacterium]|jgi:hypothetical protein|nr:hypothetical protein [Prevotellaceae bacterium]